MLILSIVVLLIIIGLIWQYVRQGWVSNEKKPDPLPVTDGQLLDEHVAYYRSLPDEKKKLFEDRVSHFLQHTRIDGVGTTVDEVDRLLVASSAVIPIFGFEGWYYYQLTNVLLYDDRFNEDYETKGGNRNILGMVGEGGALQSTMVLSKPALRDGFANENSKSNTGIHEFVHLLDKADGSTDGLPEYLLDKSHIKPWVQLIHRAIKEIKENQSDIDPYGMTNEAEFFAVVSEYFFKRPDLLAQKHPDLFARLEEIFRQNPATPGKELTESV
jgi:Mlc titration factor MtfA (ptsG expression regulator)